MRIVMPLTLFVALILGGCGSEEPPATPAGEVNTYQVRGKVVQVKDTEAMIHHEAIPTFVHITGKADGMDEMVMPFPFGEGVDPASIKPGDIIAFDFHVRWTPRAQSWIDNITTLPADTQLNINESPNPHAGHDHDHHDHAGHNHDHDHAGHDH